MSEHIGQEPADTRDLLREQEPGLMKAAKTLAQAVANLDPNLEYGRLPEALIVGGFVRDAMLGLHPKDADIEVYGVEPELLKALLQSLFGSVELVGESFAVLKVRVGDGLDLDVSIPRTESKTGKRHEDVLVNPEPWLTIQEAARRRDFTINAMSLDPLTGTVFDPFGGLEDLHNKTLRVTDQKLFQEDPLRVLRAVQFIARMNFSIDPASERLIQEMVERGDLAHLPRERIAQEFEKLLFKGKRPSVGLEFAMRNNILQASFPGAAVSHPESWMRMLDDAAARQVDRHAMLAAFISGFGPQREAVLASLKLNVKKDVQPVRALLKAGEFVELYPTNPVNDARKMLKRITPASPQAYADWIRLLGRQQEAVEFLSSVRDHQLTAEPILLGRDLIERFQLNEKKDGRLFGQILVAVEQARDEGKIVTRKQAIEFARQYLDKTR